MNTSSARDITGTLPCPPPHAQHSSSEHKPEATTPESDCTPASTAPSAPSTPASKTSCHRTHCKPARSACDATDQLNASSENDSASAASTASTSSKRAATHEETGRKTASQYTPSTSWHARNHARPGQHSSPQPECSKPCCQRSKPLPDTSPSDSEGPNHDPSPSRPHCSAISPPVGSGDTGTDTSAHPHQADLSNWHCSEAAHGVEAD